MFQNAEMPTKKWYLNQIFLVQQSKILTQILKKLSESKNLAENF